MKPITINFTAYGEAIPNRVRDTITSLKFGSEFVMSIKSPTRTIKQNNMIHAMFEEVVEPMNASNVNLMFGGFEAQWTASTIKELFVQAFLAGKRTSSVDRAVMSKGITAFLNSLAQKGIEVECKDAREFISK